MHNIYMQAFCHIHVENLLKGPEYWATPEKRTNRGVEDMKFLGALKKQVEFPGID